MKRLFLSFLLLTVGMPGAYAAVDPTELNISIYKMYVSDSEDCSNPITVFDAETDSSLFPFGFSEQNVLTDPTFGEGSIENGTYPCIIFKMSDIINFTPEETEGNCIAGTPYELDVCVDRGQGAPVTNAETGETFECSATIDESVPIWLYVSTGATSSGGGEGSNPMEPPTGAGDAEHGINLGSALVVNGALTAVLVVDGNGKITTNSEGECEMQPPVFSFETE